MAEAYVKTDEAGVLRVGRAGVMLDSVAAAFAQGHSPETIQNQYPSLTLEEVYGAIAWCLAHPQQVEEYFRRQDQEWMRWRQQAEAHTPPVVQRLRALRENPVPGKP